MRNSLEDFLVLSSEKPPQARNFNSSVPVLYTPWGNELTEGSYFYKNDWETIDHFLLSEDFFTGNGWDYDTCKLLNCPPFTNASGNPFSYMPKNGLGLSDHLPLILYLRNAGNR